MLGNPDLCETNLNEFFFCVNECVMFKKATCSPVRLQQTGHVGSVPYFCIQICIQNVKSYFIILSDQVLFAQLASLMELGHL